MNIKSIYPLFLSLLIGGILLSCLPDNGGDPVSPTPNPDPDPGPSDTISFDSEPINFLALGDSYTIGESVAETEAWPAQLRDSLLSARIDMRDLRIIARTGWTTNELQAAIEGTPDLKASYDLVSLLIGVNNQYRGYPFSQYEEEFPQLLQKALDFAGGDTFRVFVLSIPDYGATPFGQNGDPDQIGQELDEYNAFALKTAEEWGISFFDITPISREAEADPELVARDGLHPSGKMYRRWVELIKEDIRAKLVE